MGRYADISLRYLMQVLVAGLITACAQLPDYAKPRTFQSDEISGFRPTGFTYRQLAPDDFQAVSVPESLSTHQEKINAHSVIQIRLSADSSFTVTRWPLGDQISYFGSINHLAFEAVMISDKSWWSPRIKPGMTGYVLQHEQIHFALTELAARRLTTDAQKWAAKLLVIRKTPQEVHSEVFQQIKAMISSATETNKKRHEEFDKDTSLYYSPTWQAWWLERVEEELRETEPGRRGR